MIISAVIIAILLGYITWNSVSNVTEKNFLKEANYGILVDVDGLKMSVNIKGEHNNQTIVLLPGLGELSPILQFKPISEDLSDRFKVVTIEPFGYGLSDITDKERTMDNISSEIHTCIKKLGLKNYYLMAHSISGLHSLKLSNLYPKEVTGFVGLDATIPMTQEMIDYSNKLAEEQGSSDSSSFYSKAKPVLDSLGITRIAASVKPDMFIDLDPTYSYSKKDKQLIKALVVHRSGNKVRVQEKEKDPKWKMESVGMKFPETLPVLNFIATATCEYLPFWEEQHENVVTDTQHSELIKLEGTHYIHLDQRPAIVKKIKEWIN
ncbi:alpha/beta-hydrolase [Neocallimastix lanati (nom. inval.)]|jgi:pimeloyl-ACP methyl ester carboxylesterase|uniref:Alpha/beta-hydrolase n=1 Tax=Neocallimastix californiae TaxID=1754190 RepID=A0A1Y1XIH8_9FUNG|nr:alpha/beta-hydrolase [Neocallimastix sp. JGI-2020a]ORX85568.1 alpha/beta-hydrolase [Neocallimastix californiae]|eukprot:ORX85568.1 alpha/beta-hydrolase [Neocallimastix californiae]